VPETKVGSLLVMVVGGVTDLIMVIVSVEFAPESSSAVTVTRLLPSTKWISLICQLVVPVAVPAWLLEVNQ